MGLKPETHARLARQSGALTIAQRPLLHTFECYDQLIRTMCLLNFKNNLEIIYLP